MVELNSSIKPGGLFTRPEVSPTSWPSTASTRWESARPGAAGPGRAYARRDRGRTRGDDATRSPMTRAKNASRTILIVVLGALVASLGGLAATLAAQGASPLALGSVIGIALVLLVVVGALGASGRRRRAR
ncbi:MAG: hypothetical protein HDR73_08355 [Clavibacter sp.]|nr:hypothetical protein [Clavibacter sp.]